MVGTTHGNTSCTRCGRPSRSASGGNNDPDESLAARPTCFPGSGGFRVLTCKATWIVFFNLPWREAGPSKHHDDKVDSDQQVVNK